MLVECNSALVVHWLHQERCSLWYLWDYWDDLQEILLGMTVEFSHMLREKNMAVDFLAKECTAGWNNTIYSFASLLVSLMGILLMDKLSLPFLRI